MYTAEPHVCYKEAVLALQYVGVQVSGIQRTQKKRVLARQLIGLSILHISKTDNFTFYTLTRAQISLH